MKDGMHPNGYVQGEPKKQTQFDRIQSMSIKELAEFLRETVEESGCNLFDCEDFEGKPSCKCHPCKECGAYLEWLQSEVEE